MDERGDAFTSAQPAKRFFGYQQSRRYPAQRHLHISIASHAGADTAGHRIRRLDNVGCRKAARRLAGYPEPVDRERLFESLDQAGVGMRGLEVFGVRFELLDAGTVFALERLSHHLPCARDRGDAHFAGVPHRF